MFRQVDVRKKNLIINATVGLSFFLFTFLTLTGLQVFNFSHAATDIAAVVTQTGYYINTASSSINNSITLSVDATPAGAMAMAKDTINVKSNALNGYSVYLSMADSTGCVSNCNALKNDEYKIDATTGTFANPVNLAVNTWGYAIKNNTTGAPVNGFSSNYNEAVPDESTLWAALPEKGEDQLVQTINEPDNTDGINLDIFYGAKVDTSLPSGVYRGEITYTAISHDATGVVDIALVSPTTTEKLEGGERMTISTEYNFEEENLGEVKVYMNSLTSSKECANVEATIENEKLKITCDAPAYDTGKYDVRVVIPGYSKDITMAKAVSYVVDSADAKDIATTVNTGFDPTSLSINIPSGYYSGDIIDLSSLIPVYTQQYDSSKTTEQNTQDAGITVDGSNITVEEGYHPTQTIQSTSSDYVYVSVLMGAGNNIPVDDSGRRITATFDANWFKENVVEVSVRGGYSDPVGVSAAKSAGVWWAGQSLGSSGNLTSSWQNISYSAANVNTSTYPYIVIHQSIGTKEWSLGAFWYRLKIKVQ